MASICSKWEADAIEDEQGRLSISAPCFWLNALIKCFGCTVQIDHGMGGDFLGYWLSPLGLAIARKTVEGFAEQMFQFDEHGADVSRIGNNLGRWTTWVRAGGELKRCVAPEEK